jgi:predicted DNA-binding protein (MmcQ/YjbR family)
LKRPPYVGGKGWIGVVLDSASDGKMVASLVAAARGLILDKPKRRR